MKNLKLIIVTAIVGCSIAVASCKKEESAFVNSDPFIESSQTITQTTAEIIGNAMADYMLTFESIPLADLTDVYNLYLNSSLSQTEKEALFNLNPSSSILLNAQNSMQILLLANNAQTFLNNPINAMAVNDAFDNRTGVGSIQNIDDCSSQYSSSMLACSNDLNNCLANSSGFWEVVEDAGCYVARYACGYGARNALSHCRGGNGATFGSLPGYPYVFPHLHSLTNPTTNGQ